MGEPTLWMKICEIYSEIKHRYLCWRDFHDLICWKSGAITCAWCDHVEGSWE